MKIYLISGVSLVTFYYLYKYIKKYKLLLKYNNLYPKTSILNTIGKTPIIKLKSISNLIKNNVYIKLENLNPSGSIKDRAVNEMFKSIKNNYTNKIITEGTSGSTGISMSQLSNCYKLECLLFLPDDLSKDKYDLLTALNCKYHLTRPVSFSDPSNFSKLAENSVKNKNNYLYMNQFDNINNFNSHYNNTSIELLEQLNYKIDLFVFGAGTGGTIGGISKRLKKYNNKTKIVLADVNGSGLTNYVNNNVFYTKEEIEGKKKRFPWYTIVEGVGINRLTMNFKKAEIDYAIKVDDIEILHMCHFIIKNEGIFIGPSTAMNLIGLIKASKKYKYEKKNLVTIMCDNGSRYISKIYNNEYLSKKNIKFTKLEKYDNLDFIK